MTTEEIIIVLVIFVFSSLFAWIVSLIIRFALERGAAEETEDTGFEIPIDDDDDIQLPDTSVKAPGQNVRACGAPVSFLQ